MYKLSLLFTFALLCHEACNFRIKRQWQQWHQPHNFFKPHNATTPKPNSGSMSEDIILQDCLQSCPVTSEFNPVCGTDNVTYDNPGRLQCAQSCGVNVTKKRASRCPTENTTPPA